MSIPTTDELSPPPLPLQVTQALVEVSVGVEPMSCDSDELLIFLCHIRANRFCIELGGVSQELTWLPTFFGVDPVVALYAEPAASPTDVGGAS